MASTRFLLTASTAVAIAVAAGTAFSSIAGSSPASAAEAAASSNRRYGGSAAVGDGRARAYVLLDSVTGAPVEIGVALDERALQGLPLTGAGHHGAHGPVHQYILELPTEHTAPFQFVELNWNPTGHEPDGVYHNVPHFDFHFYTISKAERDAIVPTDPRYAEKANNLPTADYVPPFNAQLGPPGATPAQMSVPLMGVHWVDVRSPELQALLGKPDDYEPFTRTFIHGSWDGRFHFWEPMITRTHLVAKKTALDPAVRDELIPIPVPARYHVPGRYPTAYRITWDAKAREYRVALTGLVQRD